MPPPELDFERLVRKAQAEERLPSVSAAVFRGREIVWRHAVGLAEVEAGEEATPDHQYRIGSITKTFTAAAVMQLRDEDRLELDDPIRTHLPELPHAGPTLRRMLSHLSGLQREVPGDVWETLVLPSRDELLARLEETEQVLRPGERWHYSNLAFALLGEVVARLSGQTYEDYVSARILEPLGLGRTTWRAEPPAARGYLVDPYAERVHEEKTDVEKGATAAAGALWSTAEDICRWGAFLADPEGDVLAPETVEEMHSLQVMTDPGWTLGWGLGLMLFRRGERIFAGHNGGMPGHTSLFSYSREAKAGSVVFMASSAPSPEAHAVGLELTEKAVESFPAEPEEWRPGDAPPAELESVLGSWWSEGMQFLFFWRDGRLQARNASAPRHLPPAVFEPLGDDRFRTVSGREHGELLRVVRDEAGEAVRLYWATYPFTRTPQVFGV